MWTMGELAAFLVAGILATVMGVTLAKSQGVQLYGSDGTYLGNLNSNQYDPNSVANPFGPYGSQFSDRSINNQFGRWGSQFSPDGVRNQFSVGRPAPLGGFGR